jgi:hypothetical protein
VRFPHFSLTLPFNCIQLPRRDSNPCLDSLCNNYLQTNESVSNSFRLEAGNTVRSLGTSSTHQRCWRAMNATLSKQFEGFAECCLELARSAETTERRARFIQMAGEYRLASLLTSEELSSGPKGRRLLPAAESPPLAEAPAARAPDAHADKAVRAQCRAETPWLQSTNV